MVFKPVSEMKSLVFVMLLHFEITEISTSNSLPWPNADQIIQAVCPTSSICNALQTGRSGFDPCCTPCTCGRPNVCTTETCCFRNNTKSAYETCLYLRSKFNNVYRFTPMEEKMWSYYVVSKIPREGCYEDKGMCNSSDTNTIYPVFSQQTGNLYFNKECALCHDIDEVVDPQVAVVCDNLGTSKEIIVDEELSMFLDGDRSSFCFLYFDFPGQYMEHRECSIHAVENITTFINITNEVHLRGHYNMTIEDIGKACISDFFSPVLFEPKKKLYPNPFCYLLGEGTHIKDNCYMRFGININFIMLLNPDLNGVLEVNKIRVTNQDEVCYRNITQAQSVKYERCRPVFCPIGHILNRNGECTFISDRIIEDNRPNRWLNLILKSTTGTPMNKSTVGNITIEYLSEIVKLPIEWVISFWGIPIESTFKQSGEIIIIVRPNVLEYGLITGLPLIKSHLNKTVSLLSQPYILSVYRKKLSLYETGAVDVLKVPLCSIDNNITISNIGEEDEPSCWRIIGYNTPSTSHGLLGFEPLSKLYFCDVVQLTTFEYRLEANGFLLYNRMVSRYFHDNEFIILTGGNGDTTAKICLEDSGLSKPEVNASFKAEASILVTVYLLYTTGTYRLLASFMAGNHVMP